LKKASSGEHISAASGLLAENSDHFVGSYRIIPWVKANGETSAWNIAS